MAKLELELIYVEVYMFTNALLLNTEHIFLMIKISHMILWVDKLIICHSYKHFLNIWSLERAYQIEFNELVNYSWLSFQLVGVHRSTSCPVRSAALVYISTHF